MFTESTDRVEEKLKKRLRKAVLKVAENIGGKLFGLEAFGEDEEKNIADLQVILD